MSQDSISILRRERTLRGWSRDYVATEAEVDVATVGRWERGERIPHPRHQQKLCELFQMNAQELGFLPASLEELTEQVKITQEGSATEEEAAKQENLLTQEDLTSVDGQDGEHNAVSLNEATPQRSIQGREGHAVQEAARDDATVIVIKNAASPARVVQLKRRTLLIGAGGIAASAAATVASKIFFSASSLSTTSQLPVQCKRLLHHLLDPNSDNWINNLAWVSNSTTIAAATDSNQVSIWDAQKEVLLMSYSTTANQWVNDVSYSPLQYIAAASAQPGRGTVQVWHYPSGQTLFTHHYAAAMITLSWSLDGKLLACAGKSKAIDIWDPYTGRLVSQYPGHLGYGVHRVKWSSNGQYIASSDEDALVHVWEAATGKPVQIYKGHQSNVYDLVWSPGKLIVASASADKTLQVWDAFSGRKLQTYTGHTEAVHCIDWSHDGKYLLSGSKDKTARVWEVSTGKLVCICTYNTSIVQSVLWSSDSKSFALGSQKQGIEIWSNPVS
jgi:transcriptional regulator with XRE-family HTH domain